MFHWKLSKVLCGTAEFCSFFISTLPNFLFFYSFPFVKAHHMIERQVEESVCPYYRSDVQI